MSSSSEIRITNPKEVSRSEVNCAVCVRKPGPIAEVAIRKAAPRMAPAGEDLFSFNQMGCKNNKDQENTEPRTEWIFLANSTACGVSP